MLSTIKTKVRALILDLSKSDIEVFTYTTSSIFTLGESNIIAITKVLKNGSELGSGDYSYDSTTNKITITASLTSGDIVEINYTFYKYSDNELNEYVRASLVWLSVHAYCSSEDYELEDNEIFPTLSNKTEDLVALIGSILIKPDWTSYSLGSVKVVFNNRTAMNARMAKEDRIKRLIQHFKYSSGVNGILEIE